MRTAETSAPMQVKPDVDAKKDEKPDESGSEVNEYQDLENAFVDSTSRSSSLPKDFLEVCRKNIGRQISAELVAKKLRKTIPSKSNIHSFSWALNNALEEGEVFSFGYSTKEGLWITIKPAKWLIINHLKALAIDFCKRFFLCQIFLKFPSNFHLNIHICNMSNVFNFYVSYNHFFLDPSFFCSQLRIIIRIILKFHFFGFFWIFIIILILILNFL